MQDSASILELKKQGLPTYSLHELNTAIGTLLERGFAPRFILNCSIYKSQLKKGHLWLSLHDGTSSISAVVWSSQLKKLKFTPEEGDGVIIVGKLNFWESRASLSVQVIDIRPALSTTLRRFEVVSSILNKEGLTSEKRKRKLPSFPGTIAIMTSSPSSALSDMLRTAKDRWPLTKILLFPIPVQGEVSNQIQLIFNHIISTKSYNIQAIVIARGGGSREDLMVFDDEQLCRLIANSPIPTVTGIGHEDDLTVADLVSDCRASTPTGSIISVLPNKDFEIQNLILKAHRIRDFILLFIRKEKERLLDKNRIWSSYSPISIIRKKSQSLTDKKNILLAYSPDKLLARGFCILKDKSGRIIKSVSNVKSRQIISAILVDGSLDIKVDKINSK